MFKLEALRALHGDALLLHYGPKSAPRYALIDAGPKTVWTNSVQPRLTQLRRRTALPLRWVALSHVDEDHVMGLLDMFAEMRDVMPQLNKATAATANLFHNTPGPKAPQGGVTALGSSTALRADEAKIEAAMTRVASKGTPIAQVASYKQGADLGNLARELQVARNPPTGGRMLTGDAVDDDIVKPLRVTVVSPSLEIMQRLIKAWERELGRNGGIVTASVEKKIQNLSSIVLLVEDGARKMLLTGDALDFDVITGLEQLGMLKPEGTLKVDLLKLPHHGSEANNHTELFTRVKARHYVISADGNHGNPDEATLARLVESEKDRKCTIWITTGPDEAGAFASVLDRRYRKLKTLLDRHGATNIDVRHPKPDDLSVVIPIVK